LYVVSNVATRGVLHAQPVIHAGNSEVHPRHLRWCMELHTFLYLCLELL
jgi:hypothetical protein